MQRRKFNYGEIVVEISSSYFRPTEVDILIVKTTKAKIKMGWESETSLGQLARIMVHSDWEKIFARGIKQRL